MCWYSELKSSLQFVKKNILTICWKFLKLVTVSPCYSRHSVCFILSITNFQTSNYHWKIFSQGAGEEFPESWKYLVCSNFAFSPLNEWRDYMNLNCVGKGLTEVFKEFFLKLLASRTQHIPSEAWSEILIDPYLSLDYDQLDPLFPLWYVRRCILIVLWHCPPWY